VTVTLAVLCRVVEKKPEKVEMGEKEEVVAQKNT
jgi:hypothetical protein